MSDGPTLDDLRARARELCDDIGARYISPQDVEDAIERAAFWAQPGSVVLASEPRKLKPRRKVERCRWGWRWFGKYGS